MATITLKTSLAGPTDNAGTCKVLYEVINADGLQPEIFVVRYYPPPYTGAQSDERWEHVAYADEMANLSTAVDNPKQQTLVRRATVVVQYTSLDAADTAIKSIRSQIQRLVNELDILDKYTETQTFVISSTD